MDVNYSNTVRGSDEWFSLAQRGTKRLLEVLGDSSDVAEAEWESETDDKGRPLLTLTVRDFTGKRSFRFAPDELQSPSHTSFRMHRLWGDLLHVRSGLLLNNFGDGGGGA